MEKKTQTADELASSKRTERCCIFRPGDRIVMGTRAPSVFPRHAGEASLHPSPLPYRRSR